MAVILNNQTNDIWCFYQSEGKLYFKYILQSNELDNILKYNVVNEAGIPYLLVKSISGEINCYYWEENKWKFKTIYVKGKEANYFPIVDKRNCVHIIIEDFEQQKKYIYISDIHSSSSTQFNLEKGLEIYKCFFSKQEDILIIVAIDKEKNTISIWKKPINLTDQWEKGQEIYLQNEQLINIWFNTDNSMEFLTWSKKAEENILNFNKVGLNYNRIIRMNVFKTKNNNLQLKPFLVKDKLNLGIVINQDNLLVCYRMNYLAKVWEEISLEHLFQSVNVEEITSSSGSASSSIAFTMINTLQLETPLIINLDKILERAEVKDLAEVKMGIRRLGKSLYRSEN